MLYKMTRKYTWIALLLWIGCCGPAFSQESAAPNLNVLDSIVQTSIQNHDMPGAVLLVGHNGQVIYRKAFGNRSLEPKSRAHDGGHYFDMASLTKVIATTTAVMQLEEQGRIRMNDPVVKYIPEFGQNGKGDIAVRDLLTHYSGFAPDIDLTPDFNSREAAYSLAFAATPVAPPETQYIYSDTNFIVLAALVERITGMTLDAYCAQNIFTPLGMSHTRFLPPTDWIPQIAPTQYDENNHMLRGVVHDPRSRRMGGVAGHAGLFSPPMTCPNLLRHCWTAVPFSRDRLSQDDQSRAACEYAGATGLRLGY